MEQLEFALVPVGIVLGYGVTKVIGAWAHIIRIWHRIERPPLLYISSTALCMFLMYMNFAGLWAYQSVDFQVSVGIFNVLYLFVITLPILLFMLAVSVLVPHDIDEIDDLEGHYFASALAFYIVFFVAIAVSSLPDLLPGVSFAPGSIGVVAVFSILLSLALLSLGWIKGRAIHLSVHAVTWSMVLAALILRPLNP